MIPLPAWIDADLWTEYVQQRKKDKKEMGPTATRQRLKRLYELKAAGHDPNACIEEALNGHWLDFYAPQGKEIERAATKAVDQTAEYLREQREHAAQVAAQRAMRKAAA
jgi:hypothetical protein